MKLSQEVKQDARQYNDEYTFFEAVSRDGERKYYSKYGVAYRYTSARVRRGEIWTIYGVRERADWDPFELQDSSYYERVELITC
jgi:hypothetical protein